MELGKIQDRLEKLEQALDAQKKLMKKISESLASGNKNGSAPVTIVGNDGVTKEDFEKLKAEVADLRSTLEKSLKSVRDDLDGKASLNDLANLQANLMEKLNELM
jgi:hypothetical protein